MRRIYLIIFILLLFVVSSRVVLASSNYFLPYPSAMPGGIWYKIDLVKEKLMQFWYFGDFGQFKYNLAESDKYLVQAKTLFEYNQYLLASQALTKSDNYFRKIEPSLISASQHKKQIQDKVNLLSDAANKHIEVLEQLKTIVPASFVWKPEKQGSTTLDLLDQLNSSIEIRKGVL